MERYRLLQVGDGRQTLTNLQRGDMKYLKYVLTLLCLCVALSVAHTKPADAQSIHHVVTKTWPAPLVPEAEQIMYAEGGGVVNDGYCGWGLLPDTQALLNITYEEGPYFCSRRAYRLYKMYGFSPWVTAGWYTPGAGRTPITYY